MELQNIKKTKEKGNDSLSTKAIDSAPLRGFAAMNAETRKEIASKGGRSARRNRVDWKKQAVIL